MPAGPLKILYVEDNPSDVEVLAFLRRAGRYADALPPCHVRNALRAPHPGEAVPLCPARRSHVTVRAMPGLLDRVSGRPYRDARSMGSGSAAAWLAKGSPCGLEGRRCAFS